MQGKDKEGRGKSEAELFTGDGLPPKPAGKSKVYAGGAASGTLKVGPHTFTACTFRLFLFRMVTRCGTASRTVHRFPLLESVRSKRALCVLQEPFQCIVPTAYYVIPRRCRAPVRARVS